MRYGHWSWEQPDETGPVAVAGLPHQSMQIADSE